MEYWGKHYIANVTACKLELARNPEHIRKFTTELVKAIDMKPYGTPTVLHFGEGELTGWTVLQFIQTSNIMGHFMDHNGDLYFDVFSCKEFDKQIVLDLLEEWFTPEHIKHEYIVRQA